MADWLIEEGIAETRAAIVEAGRIVEARVEWPGSLAAGWVIDTKLVSKTAGSARGTAIAVTGEEVLIDRLPREASEGAPLRAVITRAALAAPGRLKRAQGRSSDEPLAQPGLAERLSAEGHRVTVTRRFPAGDWDEVIDQALGGEVTFNGGALLFAPTPAMTTIDIDGVLRPHALALAAIPALADALRRFDIGGSIAVDFPTLDDRTGRRAVDEALAAALAGWPHERTAINGFGLVQIVARVERASILQKAAWQRPALVWRRLLRTAEVLTGAGVLELAIHPSVERVVEPAHLAAVERRTGRRVRVCKLATLAADAPNAQIVSDD